MTGCWPMGGLQLSGEVCQQIVEDEIRLPWVRTAPREFPMHSVAERFGLPDVHMHLRAVAVAVVVETHEAFPARAEIRVFNAETRAARKNVSTAGFDIVAKGPLNTERPCSGEVESDGNRWRRARCPDFQTLKRYALNSNGGPHVMVAE